VDTRRIMPRWSRVLVLATLAFTGVINAQTPTSGLTGTFSGLVYNRASSTFNSVLTLTNTGSVRLSIPISVVISTGTSAVTVAGTPDGSTYSATVPGGSIAPGQSAKVVVAFSDRSRVAFTPTIISIGGTVSSSSSTIKTAAPTISLTNVASVDFAGQTALAGRTATIAQVVDTYLNTVASDAQVALDTNLSEPTAIQVTVPVAPTGIVSLTAYAATALSSLGTSEIPTLYVYSTAAGAGDGDDTFEPLPASVDTSTDTITVNVPGLYFLPASSGVYTLTLKIGIASIATASAPIPAQSLMARSLASKALATATSATTILALPCPLPSIGCVERSRWNPNRVLSAGFKPHNGVDFVAPIGIPLVVPAGGTPIQAFTNCANSVDAGCNRAAGNYLTINYPMGAYRLRLLHLTSIDSALLVSGCAAAANCANTSASTGTATVAISGATGAAATLGPHLHYELISPTLSVCYAGGTCWYVLGRSGSPATDPFPFVASKLSFQLNAGQATLGIGATYEFLLSAHDAGGVPVSSAVGNPHENDGIPSTSAGTPYDPTRKVCLSSSAPGVLQFPSADNEATLFTGVAFGGAGSSICAPWSEQNEMVLTALADSPSTIVSAAYSKDSAVPIAQDPLVNTGQSVTLNSGGQCDPGAATPRFLGVSFKLQGTPAEDTLYLTFCGNPLENNPVSWLQTEVVETLGTTSTFSGSVPLYLLTLYQPGGRPTAGPDGTLIFQYYTVGGGDGNSASYEFTETFIWSDGSQQTSSVSFVAPSLL
jgi:hypothetical protein